jgi:hypothetical protein
MQRQHVDGRWTRFAYTVRRIWLDIIGEDLRSTHRQLDRMIDGVCDRYSVARISVEQEIYNGLQLLTHANPSAAIRHHDDANL